MKEYLLKFVSLVFLFVGINIVPVSAQGFSSILEKLKKLEIRLDKMEAGQLKDVRGLQRKLAELNKAGTGNPENLDSLKKHLSFPADEIKNVKSNIPKKHNNNEAKTLATALLTLTTELSTVLSSPPEQGNDTGTTTENISSTTAGIEISGFVDATYFYDGNTFGLDQVEIDLEKSIGENASIRTDLEWVSDGAGGFALEAEQGFITFAPSFLGSVNLTFGKFNAPIGFALLDAPYMFQYSHALVFDNGLPTNLNGAMFSSNLNESVDLSVYVCNGWDQNVDNTQEKP